MGRQRAKDGPGTKNKGPRTFLIMEYAYRPDVLGALQRHGIAPTVRTSPELARRFVRDLYCYQLRALRDRLLRREFPKHEYANRVVALRDNYRVLSLRAREWLVD